MTKQFTPQDIIKVVESIIETQKEKGFKAGWAYYEMERRAGKVARELSWYPSSAMGVAGDLAMNTKEIASGKLSISEFENTLNEYFEMA